MKTPPPARAPLLGVEALTIALPDGARLVEDVSFAIAPGETVALVGESGCGKSITALAVIGLLPPDIARNTTGRILFDGVDLRTVPAESLRALRGDRLAMIFQDPMTALNPVMTIGAQIAEVLRAHRGMGWERARRRAIELLDIVRIPDARNRYHEFPHRLSGGMRQRVTIAMAIACDPVLLIADEATTALDVTVQAQILDLLKELQREAGLSLLLITHDLGIVRRVADRMLVMYCGAIVEQGPADRVLAAPRHPYTAGLLAARPSGNFAAGGHRLLDIRGAVPPPHDRPLGCVFAPRCPRAAEDCRAARPLLTGEARAWRCHHPLEDVGA